MKLDQIWLHTQSNSLKKTKKTHILRSKDDGTRQWQLANHLESSRLEIKWMNWVAKGSPSRKTTAVDKSGPGPEQTTPRLPWRRPSCSSRANNKNGHYKTTLLWHLATNQRLVFVCVCVVWLGFPSHERPSTSIRPEVVVAYQNPRFYRVLPGFTGFYWALLGFTGFSWF